MLLPLPIMLALAASAFGCADIHLGRRQVPQGQPPIGTVISVPRAACPDVLAASPTPSVPGALVVPGAPVVTSAPVISGAPVPPVASATALSPAIDGEPELGGKKKGRKVIDFDYANSQDWAFIQPEYILCQSGATQSPINLLTAQGTSINHKPVFNYKPASGDLFNWGFGPAMTFTHRDNDFTTLPSMTFDGETVFMVGWHIHFPSEHLFDGKRARAEMHFVHVTAAGKERSVVGIPIEVSNTTPPSPFMATLAQQPPIGVNDTTVRENITMDPGAAIFEVGLLSQFWTYNGSLTTPPCSEGLRWFLPFQTMKVTSQQLFGMLGVSRFSARTEQNVWLQEVNV